MENKELTPLEVVQGLRGHTGPSTARAIAAYHALVTGQEIPSEEFREQQKRELKEFKECMRG